VMVPELLMVSWLRMPSPAVFDIVMMAKLLKVPGELLKMPLPPVFDIVMVLELVKVPRLRMPSPSEF